MEKRASGYCINNNMANYKKGLTWASKSKRYLPLFIEPIKKDSLLIKIKKLCQNQATKFVRS